MRRMRRGLLADLAAGRKIELNTGLFTDNEPARLGTTAAPTATSPARTGRTTWPSCRTAAESLAALGEVVARERESLNRLDAARPVPANVFA